VRERGFAVDIEEFVPNLCCVSVPVCDREGRSLVAAISIAMPKMRFRKTLVPGWCRHLQEKAAFIAQQAGLVGI
jgi:DNA-binding IclR family transcriptional regulator